MVDHRYGEGEVGVGIRLVLEGEMPPLLIVWLEAMLEHHCAENHPVLELLGGDVAVPIVLLGVGVAAEVGVALSAEPVESAAHIHFLAPGHVEQRQVDRAAAAVSGFFGNIALRKQDGFVQRRIKIRFHADIADLFCPSHEMVDRPLGTVGVIDFEAPLCLREAIRRSSCTV